MTNHPITPTHELIMDWCKQRACINEPGPIHIWLATEAARWGADRQLAEDAKWLDHNALNEPHLRITPVGESLKEAMRPRPLSLKAQALRKLSDVYGDEKIDDHVYDTIRRALEALPA